MSLTENSLRKVLEGISRDIVEREGRRNPIMVNCVGDRLRDSLEQYESSLDSACRYVMIRNPVVMTKDFTLLGSGKNKENEK